LPKHEKDQEIKWKSENIWNSLLISAEKEIGNEELINRELDFI